MATAKKSETRPKGLLIWLVSGLGLTVILAALVIVIIDAVRGSAPVDLRVTERSRTQQNGVTLVDIDIRNDGGEAAAAVEIEGRPANGETAGVTLDYVAGHSTRGAVLVFPGDPGPVTLTATGWSEP